MDEQLKSNLTSSKHWIRLLYMLLFVLALYVASVVMSVLIFVQFLFALITGNNNYQLRKFGDALSIYIFDTLQFLIYNSENKPFPFADWPESKATETAEDAQAEAPGAEPDSASNAKPKATPRKKASPRKKATAKKPAKETDSEPPAEEGNGDSSENKTPDDKSES